MLLVMNPGNKARVTQIGMLTGIQRMVRDPRTEGTMPHPEAEGNTNLAFPDSQPSNKGQPTSPNHKVDDTM